MLVGAALHAYVGLVSGLTRVPREKAAAAARSLLAQAGLEEVADDAGERVNRLTEEILAAGRANRELLDNLVRAEVGRTAGRWGFVRAEELDEVREEIAEVRVQLQRRIDELAATTPTEASPTAAAPRKTAAPRRTAAPRKTATPRKAPATAKAATTTATPRKTATPRTAARVAAAPAAGPTS